MPIYARDIIITPESGSIIFSGSANGGLSSSLIVDDSGSLNINIVENGNLSINGIILATASKIDITGSITVTGSINTDDLTVNNIFTLNGSLDLGSF